MSAQPNHKRRDSRCVSLETVSFVDIKERINSPRSLEALGTLGIDVDKLYYMSFNDFIYRHPELRNISKDLQEKRYNHYESKRQTKIQRAKDKRQEIITYMTTTNNNKRYRSKSVSDYHKERASTMIKSEQEKLRLLKNQQIGELKNMIEFEYKMEEIRKRNAEKIQQQQLKEEEMRRHREMMRKEKERQQKMQEKRKEERIRAEMEEYERKEKERKEEDKRLYLEEMKKKEELEKEKQRRMNESKKKQEEFKKKIESIITAQQNELLERQKELLRKEEQRKMNLEEIKRMNYIQHKEKQKKTQERIDKALSRNDSAFSSKQNDYERKQKQAEEIRKRFALERLNKQRQQEIQNRQKELEIIEVLKRNDELIQKRIETYNDKQKKIKERQRERDVILQQQMKDKRIKLHEKERKCIEARQRNERLIEEDRKKILLKIALSENKIQKQKDINNRLYMERYIESAIRKDDIEENILEKEKAMEFKRLQRLYEIEEKNKRVEDMKVQKMELYEQRRKMNRDMQKHKEKMLGKFDYLMKNAKMKGKDEIMKELFNEDYSYVDGIETKSKVNKSKSCGSLVNPQSNARSHNESYCGKKEEFDFITNVRVINGKREKEYIKEEEVNRNNVSCMVGDCNRIIGAYNGEEGNKEEIVEENISVNENV